MGVVLVEKSFDHLNIKNAFGSKRKEQTHKYRELVVARREEALGGG